MRALVTGAAGFVGQWLCRALLRDGWTVVGTALGAPPPPGILSATEVGSVRWRTVDLRPDATERRSVRALIEQHSPDAIFHLAGVAFQPAASDDPAGTLAVNVGAVVRLLAALRGARSAGVADPTLLVVGSAEQYGRHPDRAMPLTEAVECRPVTFYGATKVAQEAIALAAFRADGVRVVATRSFNHSGRGQSTDYLLPALVARALRARSGGGAVPIGNTEHTRDLLHVEDVVAAYISLVARGVPGEVYNVCSGEGVRVGDLAAEVLAAVGARGGLQPDPALQRASDVPVLVGDNAKLRAATGWSPRRTRSDIISDLLDAAS